VSVRRAALIAAMFASGMLRAPSASAAHFVLVSGDDPGEGLNDPAVVTPTGGNKATTRGAARSRRCSSPWTRAHGALLHGSEPRPDADGRPALRHRMAGASPGRGGPGSPVQRAGGADHRARRRRRQRRA
jgi:hypothetical protein